MATAEWDKVRGVKAMLDAGTGDVPSFYIKPPESRPSAGCDNSVIPVIDLAELHSEGRKGVVQLLQDASSTWGFFQVINHGIHLQLMKEILEVGHSFFELPEEEKMIHYSEDFSSPVRFGTSFNPSKEKILDWQDHILHRFYPDVQGPHPWPKKPLRYGEVADKYIQQAKNLATEIAAALSEGLGLDSTRLEDALGKKQQALRLNYYPPCRNPELAMGLSSHSDTGGLTILLQDKYILGLQVKHGEDWHNVRPESGALVVNIGDQFQILSNGKYKSSEHRAIVNSEKTRLSVGLFWDPSSDVLISPIPEILDEQHPPLYKANLYGDYVANLFSSKLLGKSWVDSSKLSSDS